MQSLQGTVALIVGGTTGIGLATARAFISKGSKVVVSGRNPERGAAAELALRAFGDASFHPCDVVDPSSIAKLVAWTLDRFGQLDCAVNCAASEAKSTATHQTSFEDACNTMSADVLGVFNCMKYEIEALLRFGGGTIVNIASINGLSGESSASMYSAGKHAVIGLTRSTAREYIARGIRINAVCPGLTDTPRRTRRMEHLTGDQLRDHLEKLAESIPIGRVAEADEIARAVLWLSSPASSYVVGHSLVVDGGLLA